ncbi:glycosyltransferase family 39 protein, partial [Candidatus Roizmanbacteria bacterium]|nr:glycosyltransferase family 39 protein [Candidatus Roizmanbacteria bacterium]
MSKLKKTSQDSKIIITLFIIFFASFLIRLISLSQSLWLDEATTARVIQQYNFLEIITKFSPTDFHPPLYYLFMKVWTNVFGYSEIVLRFPSVIFSLLTGYVVYIIGKLVINDDSGRPRDKLGVARMTKEQTGFWAAVFFLFNPLIVYYSQEARMYMMVTFLLTVTLYYFIIVCHAELVSASDSKSRSRNKFGMTKA